MRWFGILLLLTLAARGDDTQAQALVDASAKALKRDSTLALLLAREALSRADIEPARSAVYAALARTRERTIFRHGQPVLYVDMAPDGTVATASEDGTARLWTSDGESILTMQADGPVQQVHFLGGSDRVCTVTPKSITVWDRGGQQLGRAPATPVRVVPGGVLLGEVGAETGFLERNGKFRQGLKGMRVVPGAGGVAYCLVESDGRVHIHDARGRKKTLRARKGTRDVALASNGETLATFGSGTQVELWSDKGKLIATLGHAHPVAAVSVCARNGHVLTGATTGGYTTWDSTGKLLGRSGMSAPVDFVHVSEDGTFSITLEGGSIVRTYSVYDDAMQEYAAKRLGKRVRSISPNPTGFGHVVAFEDGSHGFYDLGLKPVGSLNMLRGKLTTFDWSQDRLLVAGDKGRIALQHWHGGSLSYFDAHTGPITHARFSPDETQVVSASRDGTARLWTIHPEDSPVLYHEHRVTSLHMREKRKRLVSTAWTEVYFRDLEGKQLAKVSLPHAADWTWSGGDRFVCVARDELNAFLFDLNGKLIAELPHRAPVTGVALTSKGDRVLSFSRRASTVKLWSKRGKPQKELPHPNNVTYARFLPDDRHAATIDASNTLRIWTTNGKEKSSWQVPERPSYCHPTPKGDRILTVEAGGPTVRIWDLKGTELARLEGHTGAVYSVWVHEETGDVLTASADKTARVWSPDGKQRAVLRHPDEVLVTGALPDRRGWFTTCRDGTARHWSHDGKLVGIIDGHSGPTHRYQLFRNGTWIATASDDLSIRYWPTTRAGLLETAKKRACRDFTVEERKQYAALLR
ncbi:MAG: WD40 repeat domain-containing protein [Planctomycetota bacterium]